MDERKEKRVRSLIGDHGWESRVGEGKVQKLRVNGTRGNVGRCAWMEQNFVKLIWVLTAARSTQTPTSIYRIQHLTTSAAHHHLRSSGAQYRPDGKSSYGESEPSRSQGNKPEAESIAPVVSIDLFRILDPKYNSFTHRANCRRHPCVIITWLNQIPHVTQAEHT